MGVDTIVRLPDDVRVNDVCKATAVLAGLKFTKCYFKGDTSSWYIEVAGSKVATTCVPEMVTIELDAGSDGLLVDGIRHHSAYYHFECEHGPYRTFSVRSTPFWIAVGAKLVKLFGGHMIANDCDNDITHRATKPRPSNHPSNGEPWQELQRAISNLKPVTKSDMDKASKWASYK